MLSFITKQKISVATEIKEVELPLMSYVLDFYISSFCNVHIVLRDGDLCPREEEILSALRETKIVWKKKLKKSLFRKKLDPEIQLKKNNLYIQWTGNVTHSALYHGLTHIVRRKIKGDLDKEHKDKLWWDLAEKFKRDLEEKVMHEFNMIQRTMHLPLNLS